MTESPEFGDSIALCILTSMSSLQAALLRGKIVDDADGSLVPARLYIKSDEGRWYHASWIALRCFEDRADQRPRFAHTAPFHFEIAERPLRPRKEEIEYLIRRVEDELNRHQNVLSPESLTEFENALRAYKNIDTHTD